MTGPAPTSLATLGSAGWTISVIAILIVVAIAWNAFGGAEDLRRARRRMRRRRARGPRR